MPATVHSPAPSRLAASAAADPLKRQACLQVIIKFVDDTVRVFYSRDIDHKGQWKDGNIAYWVDYWKPRIEFETPPGWAGRVKEAGIFASFDGTRGDKLLQFDRRRGWLKCKP